MTAPLGLHWYPAAPIPLDVVWCHWPLTAGGFKNRPCLVNRVLEQVYGDTVHYAVEVAYGTSRVNKSIRKNVGSFVIAKYEELQAIPLYQATRFELLTLQILPWTEEWFPTAPGRTGPVVGHMTQHQIVRLHMFCEMKKMMIAALDAGTSTTATPSAKPDGPDPAPMPIAFATDGDGSDLETKR